MKTKKIFMACFNYWTSPFQVGSHHLARGFVEAGYDVAFVSSPISPLHLAGHIGHINRELCERYAIYKSGGQRHLGGHIWTYAPGSILIPYNTPLLRSEWANHNWHKLTFPSVVKKVKDAGFGEVDIIYFDNPNQAFWLDIIKHKKSMFRIADKNSGFEGSTAAMRKLESDLARSVDAVIYTAEHLKDYVEAMHPKSAFHIPNGVNFKHFKQASRSVPDEYKNLSKPIALYVGAMESWFDYDLVNRAAAQLPHVSFVLIGSDQVARAQLKHLDNIHILGCRPYSELPRYLYNADVGIIPFDVGKYPELVNGIHPLKLYEYLACGLPVVSVEWEEIRNLKSPAVLCQTGDRFIEAISTAVTQPQEKDALVKYASEADWSVRVKTIFNFLGMSPA